MTKTNQTDQFHVGQRVKFHTNLGTSRAPVRVEDYGKIVKLHPRTCRQGSAEIVPENPLPTTGSRKITRRMQHVFAA